MSNSKVRRRLAAAAALMAVAGLSVLAGAGSGHAGTVITPTLTQLIGTTAIGVPQVSPGGNIAYQLDVANTGDSTVTQVSVTVTSAVASFLDYVVVGGNVAPVCSGSGNTLSCTPPNAKLAPGNSFSVDVRFTVPSTTTASQVVTTAVVTVAAKTVGGAGNGGTTSTSDSKSIGIGGASPAAFSTFLRGSEHAQTDQQLGTAHPQGFRIGLPATLFGGSFGVPLSLVDNNAGSLLCATCLSWHTTVTVPPAAQVGLAGNPFYNGTTPNPYSWSMSALYPPGFKVTGVYYLPDGATNAVLLPTCSGPPSASAPLCVQTLVQQPSTKTLTATGLGIENGNLGFG